MSVPSLLAATDRRLFMIKVKQRKSEWFEFIPKYNGNNEFPEAERITCQVKYMTQAEQDGLIDRYMFTHKGGKQNQVSWTKAKNEIINTHVKDVKNVVIELEDGSEKELKTMGEIYEIAELSGLYKEIGNALDAENMLLEGELKN